MSSEPASASSRDRHISHSGSVTVTQHAARMPVTFSGCHCLWGWFCFFFSFLPKESLSLIGIRLNLLLKCTSDFQCWLFCVYPNQSQVIFTFPDNIQKMLTSWDTHPDVCMGVIDIRGILLSRRMAHSHLTMQASPVLISSQADISLLNREKARGMPQSRLQKQCLLVLKGKESFSFTSKGGL